MILTMINLQFRPKKNNTLLRLEWTQKSATLPRITQLCSDKALYSTSDCTLGGAPQIWAFPYGEDTLHAESERTRAKPKPTNCFLYRKWFDLSTGGTFKHLFSLCNFEVVQFGQSCTSTRFPYSFLSSPKKPEITSESFIVQESPKTTVGSVCLFLMARKPFPLRRTAVSGPHFGNYRFNRTIILALGTRMINDFA